MELVGDCDPAYRASHTAHDAQHELSQGPAKRHQRRAVVHQSAILTSDRFTHPLCIDDCRRTIYLPLYPVPGKRGSD